MQPICREDGSLAVSDEEIFKELKKRYGKESLDVKDYDIDWYESVENDVLLKSKEYEEEISKPDFKDMCGHENSDLYVEEIEAAISNLNNNSAPSPEEGIFNILLKKGGESMVRALHFIFQKSWSSGELPVAFKIDPKVMMPKPGKSDYNAARAYRPITLESVIGKVMERVICKRLTWKLEVEGGLAATQYAYRKQKSCVQSMVRLCNSVTEARNRKQHTIMTVMDFESCYERIWRAGLLHKASNKGIRGRMWLYLKNFVTDIKYYITVNNYKSQLYPSAVGIPQGSVISPVLCNLYTSDSMDEVRSNHAEYADDSGVWSSDESLPAAAKVVNQDLVTEKKWCSKWNMLIAADKTEVMIFPWDGRQPLEPITVKYGEDELKVTSSKKVLGVVLDSSLNFKDHVQEKTKAGFAALRGIDSFVSGHRGCSQSVYMRLYKALVLPVMEYGAPMIVSALPECSREFDKIQRHAMIKASGCLGSTSTDTLEILTNTPPIDLHLKMRQAQEVVRISAKHEDDPIREEFNTWIGGGNTIGRKPTIFHLLMCRFREMSGRLQFDSVEKDFKYSKDLMGLIKVKGKVEDEDFVNTKSDQVNNVIEILSQIKENEVVIFTDGLALGNPGPTGAGAAVYLNGYQSSPILLKKGVSPLSNNYTGELVGIQIALDFMIGLEEQIKDTQIHFFTDCQPAIKAAFNGGIPSGKVDIILQIKESVNCLSDSGNDIIVHWVPGHRDIEGNELADCQAKEAANEMVGADTEDFPVMMDKKEAVAEIKRNLKDKWKRKFELSDKACRVQEVFTEVGKRNCIGEEDRHNFSMLNQLLSGHTLLNQHRARLDENVSEMCPVCLSREDPEHFLFYCKAYDEERRKMVEKVEEVLNREGLDSIGDINLRVLTGNIENLSIQGQTDMLSALMQFIKCTNRFSQN